jgi:hypothetical protein
MSLCRCSRPSLPPSPSVVQETAGCYRHVIVALMETWSVSFSSDMMLLSQAPNPVEVRIPGNQKSLVREPAAYRRRLQEWRQRVGCKCDFGCDEDAFKAPVVFCERLNSESLLTARAEPAPPTLPHMACVH